MVVRVGAVARATADEPRLPTLARVGGERLGNTVSRRGFPRVEPAVRLDHLGLVALSAFPHGGRAHLRVDAQLLAILGVAHVVAQGPIVAHAGVERIAGLLHAVADDRAFWVTL